jgi:hypothetical protein
VEFTSNPLVDVGKMRVWGMLPLIFNSPGAEIIDSPVFWK